MGKSKEEKRKKKVPAAAGKTDLADEMYNHDFDFNDEAPLDYDRNSAATVMDHILLNRPLKAVLAMAVCAVVIPTLLYGYMYGVAQPPQPFGTCVILPDFWTECMPGQSPIKKDCETAGCCWNSTLEFCFNTNPARHNYYFQNQQADPEQEPAVLLPRLKTTPFLNPSHNLSLSMSAVTDSHITVEYTTKIKEDNTKILLEDSKIKVEITRIKEESNEKVFWYKLYRRRMPEDPDEVLFTTENGPLIASDGYWELSLQFPADTAVLGAGSVARKSLRLSEGNATLYSGLRGATNGRPFLLCLHQSGNSHGVLFDSPGALEIVARKSNLVTLRSTTYNEFKMHVFIGNSPAEVIQNVKFFNGLMKMPPYWSLGLHICRDDARNETHNTTLEFIETANELQLPYDSDCVDYSALGITSLNLEENRLESLKDAIRALHNEERHFLLTLFPQVSNDSVAYKEGLEKNLFLRGNNSVYLGLHRHSTVAYPDFLDSTTGPWLETQLQEVLKDLTELPSGLILPDNWPLNEDISQQDWPLNEDGTNNGPLPIYVPHGLAGSLSNGTVWWQAHHIDGRPHHEHHAVYGANHAKHAHAALSAVLNSNLRVPVLSAAMWPGSEEGSWMGDDQPATWDGLKGALLSVLEAGLSGEVMSGGGSVCGSSGNWSETLCTRWSLLALAAFPTVRYHHAWEEPPRDPSFMSETSARIVARAAKLRYQLLPYIYTLVKKASDTGMPLLRPMALEFPTDNATWSLDEQVMLGSSVMIAPDLQPASVSIKIYLPKPATPWYYLQDGEPVKLTNNTGEVTLLSGENELVMLIRGGHIIAMQESNSSSASSRRGARHVVAALHCTGPRGDNCTAEGHLYEDDGVSTNSKWQSINFTATATTLTVASYREESDCVLPSFYRQSRYNTTLDSIFVYGVPAFVTGKVKVNGEELEFAKLFYNSELQRLVITNINKDWCDEDLEFEWNLITNAE